MRRRVLVCTIFPIFAILGGAGARADTRIAIEVDDGERPGDASAVLAPLHAELGRRGYLVGPMLAATLGKSFSRAGGSLSASQMVDAQKDVDGAYQRMIDGDYVRAFSDAHTALTLFDAAPAALAREPSLRDLRLKALVIAARSAEANGQGQDAFALMAEVIRSFPDRPISNAQFDPTATQLYRKVKEALAGQGAGALEIKVDDPAATIFVDEQFAASGTAKLDKLAPGRYRVYVTKGQAVGRVREIDLAPGATATLDVPWTLDAALREDASGVALAVEKADDALPAAVQLGHALGAKTVVLLSVRPLNAHRAIVAYSVDVESQTRTFAAVQIDPIAPSAETIGKLAALLAGDKVTPSPELITTEPGGAVARAAGAALHRGHRATWIVGGIGVASLLAAGDFELSSRSTYDQSKTEPDDAKQKSLYDSANTKYKVAQGFAIGGAACVIGGAILMFAHGGSEPEHGVAWSPAVVPGGAAVLVTGRF